MDTIDQYLTYSPRQRTDHQVSKGTINATCTFISINLNSYMYNVLFQNG